MRVDLAVADRRIAILGAGIMGTSLALFLARRGREVVLFDREAAPMAAASRWNEGKIHLGYLYGADPTLFTARHVLPGGLAFGRLIAELAGSGALRVTQGDDLYVIHRNSVASTEALERRYAQVDALIRDHPDAGGYLADLRSAATQRVPLDDFADPRTAVAAFEVPERSVETQSLADALVAALRAEPRIELRMSTEILAAEPEDAADGPWRVRGPDLDGRFDVVVNALWNGRLAVDATAGLPPSPPWSHRYRLSIFARTREALDVPSAVVAVGPFGDVKNYTGRDFYVSWYPAGLIADSEAVDPAPPARPACTSDFIAAVRAGLAGVLPRAARILDAAESLRVEGGFVFAQGRGSIGDPGSSLHRRDRFGVLRQGRYFSVDTGKYSTAPWMAQRLAVEICGE